MVPAKDFLNGFSFEGKKNKLILSDLSLAQMQDYVKGQGLPAFRGKQLFDAIYSAKSFDEVTNLPKNMPQEIVESYPKYKIL